MKKIEIHTKKLLVLENEYLEDFIKDEINVFAKAGSEVKVIERAVSHQAEVVEALNWCDSILFFTTWTNSHEVHALGQLLMSIEPITVYAIEHQDTLIEGLVKTFSVDELLVLHKHKVKLTPMGWHVLNEIEDFDWSWLDTLVQAEAVRKQKELNNKQTRNTGRNIRILDVHDVGKEWSQLKKGMIVKEKRRPEDDPNRNSGVWVQGLTEPVKLLNNNGMLEFEYVPRDGEFHLRPEDVAREFGSACGFLANSSLMDAVTKWFTKVSKPHSKSLSDSETWFFITDILDNHGVPRRLYRQFFTDRIKALRDKNINQK